MANSWRPLLVLAVCCSAVLGQDLEEQAHTQAKSMGDNSRAMLRAVVPPTDCLASPSVTMMDVGDTFTFSTGEYEARQKCSWKIQSPAGSKLSLVCSSIYLDWFTKLYVVDGDTTRRKGCFFCFIEGSFSHEFSGNEAQVGLENSWVSTNKGFQCTMTAYVPCKCGEIVSTRIVGGTESPVGAYPWVTGIRFKWQDLPLCGGALITDQFVLTAAHCTFGLSEDLFEVLLGVHDFNNIPSTAIQTDVLKIIEHSDYDTIYYKFDAALLQIEVVDFKLTLVRPICLPVDASQSYSGDLATVAGWGTIVANGAQSPVMLEVQLPVLTNDNCQSLLTNYTIVEEFLCAGGTEVKDSCQGDSGGALWVSPSGGGGQVATTVGVVSHGDSCAAIGRPGVYTRITAILGWIIKKTSRSVTCSRP